MMQFKTKKQELESAKNHLDHCSKVLKVNEIKWQEMWDMQLNPFLKIQEYNSPEQKAMRKPIIDEWLAAKKKYFDLRAKQPKNERDNYE